MVHTRSSWLLATPSVSNAIQIDRAGQEPGLIFDNATVIIMDSGALGYEGKYLRPFVSTGLAFLSTASPFSISIDKGSIGVTASTGKFLESDQFTKIPLSSPGILREATVSHLHFSVLTSTRKESWILRPMIFISPDSSQTLWCCHFVHISDRENLKKWLDQRLEAFKHIIRITLHSHIGAGKNCFDLSLLHLVSTRTSSSVHVQIFLLTNCP